MALLVMAAVMATATGLAVIVIGQLRITNNFDTSLQAYYAAETGLEQALWRIADNRKNKGVLADALSDAAPGQVVIDSVKNVRYTIDPGDVVAQSGEFTVPELLENRSAQLDLFDSDGTNINSDVASLRLSWSDDCAGCTRLEITAISWAEGGTINPDGGRVEKFFRTYGEQGTALPLDSSNVYSIRLKNLGVAGQGTVRDLTLTARDASSNTVDIPSRIQIRSEGQSAASRQTLQAELPWRVPISSLFDYVLFSEEGIDK